jgi:hypothetical protein
MTTAASPLGDLRSDQEELHCERCDQSFVRRRVRGIKPSTCPTCKAADREAVDQRIAERRRIQEARHREQEARRRSRAELRAQRRLERERARRARPEAPPPPINTYGKGHLKTIYGHMADVAITGDDLEACAAALRRLSAAAELLAVEIERRSGA